MLVETSHLKHFSVVIASHNEGEWLQKTVSSVLSETDYPSFEIAVVADGCTDHSADFLNSESHKGVHLITLDNSVGVAKARNIGALKSSGEYIVFIDSHMLVQDPHWLRELADQLRRPEIGAASLKIRSVLRPHMVLYIYSIGDLTLEPAWFAPRSYTDIQEAPAIPGACFGIRREVFEETEGFDGNFRKWGREEIEYSLRLWRLGYQLVMSPRAAIAHRFKFDAAGKPQQNYMVHWGQLTYNIVRTALILLPTPWAEKVMAQLAISHKNAVRAALADLHADDCFQTRKKALADKFVRSFEDFIGAFRGWLPFAGGVEGNRSKLPGQAK